MTRTAELELPTTMPEGQRMEDFFKSLVDDALCRYFYFAKAGATETHHFDTLHVIGNRFTPTSYSYIYDATNETNNARTRGIFVAHPPYRHKKFHDPHTPKASYRHHYQRESGQVHTEQRFRKRTTDLVLRDSTSLKFTIEDQDELDKLFGDLNLLTGSAVYLPLNNQMVNDVILK